jgi:hypothetical protein
VVKLGVVELDVEIGVFKLDVAELDVVKLSKKCFQTWRYWCYFVLVFLCRL